MSTLTELPIELIKIIIEDHLQRPEDIFPCVLLNRRFHAISEPILYQKLDQSHCDCLIFWAISKNQQTTLKKLLQAGASPQALFINSFCAAMHAGFRRSKTTYKEDLAKFMPGSLERGVRGCLGNLYQPLHHAVLFENCKMIDALLDAGALIHGCSAEAILIMEDDRTMIDNVRSLDIIMASPVGLAIGLGLEKIVLHLFARGADPKKPLIALERWYSLMRPENNSIHMASQHGRWEMVEMLWEEGFCTDLYSPNAHGYTALWSAVTKHKLHIIEWLVAHGADLNQNQGRSAPITPLEWACKTANFDMALRLVDLGADVRKSQSALRSCVNCIIPETPIQAVQRCDQISLIKRLLREGADVKGRCGEELLYEVVRRGDSFVAKILRDAGA
ncbi:hypothetical protein PG990_012475 [Apiospora arundinis]